MTEYLNVKNISKTFPAQRRREEVAAVRNVSFVLRPGESLGIIGPSGCGKTTLSRMLLGLMQPDSGVIQRNGTLGFVPQDPYAALDPSMSVLQLVGEPLRYSRKAKNWKQCQEPVRHALSQVALDYKTYADRLPSALSGGERQRISIARALVREPKVLILDEPTSMLDEDAKDEIAGLLRHLSEKEDRAFLLITHDIALSASLCKQLIIMQAGQIIEQGPNILECPKTKLARQLVLAATDLKAYWAQSSDE